MFLISVPCKEKSALEVVSSWDPRTHLLGLAVVMPLISLIGTRHAPQSHPCKIHFVTGPSSHGTVRSDCCGRKVLGASHAGCLQAPRQRQWEGKGDWSDLLYFLDYRAFLG